MCEINSTIFPNFLRKNRCVVLVLLQIRQNVGWNWTVNKLWATIANGGKSTSSALSQPPNNHIGCPRHQCHNADKTQRATTSTTQSNNNIPTSSRFAKMNSALIATLICLAWTSPPPTSLTWDKMPSFEKIARAPLVLPASFIKWMLLAPPSSCEKGKDYGVITECLQDDYTKDGLS